MARKAAEPLSARGRPGQRARPSPSNAMPKHRPSIVPTPETSVPSSSLTTIEGFTIRARPVPTSTAAAKARIFIRGWRLASFTRAVRTASRPLGSLPDWRGSTRSAARGDAPALPAPRLVSRLGDRILKLPLVLRGQLGWSEVDGQLVDPAVECERHLVILVVHRCAGINPDVEGLVGHLEERDRVWLLLGRHDLSVDLEHPRAAFRDPRTVIRVLEHDGVLARGKGLRAFPAILGEDE